MIQIVPQLRILVAVEAVAVRRGIDGLSRVCRDRLASDPCSGTLFVFHNRRGTGIKILTYDGQGFLRTLKRLSKGRVRWWPTSPADAATALEAHPLQRLIMAGDPAAPDAAPMWRRLRLPA